MKCAQCGKPIKRSNKFCSMECYGLSRRKGRPYLTSPAPPELIAEMQDALDRLHAYYRERYGHDYVPKR